MIIKNGVLFKVNNAEIVNGTFEIPEGVTMIDAGAFYCCSNLESIKIPEGITSIGRSAFYGCTSFMSVDIPNSVTEIGERAFADCKILKDIKMSESLTSIENELFSGCTSLTSIQIPQSVKSINEAAFEQCVNLTDIKIPEGVTYIGPNTFKCCSSLENIQLPETVTRIGTAAFLECNALTNIKLPKNVTEIYRGLFSGCSKLKNVEISEATTRIGRNAFCWCSSLDKLEMPETVVEIEENAFSGCSSLKSIKIPNGVTAIKDTTFQECSSLENIEMPDSVKVIGEAAFESCISLTHIKIPKEVTVIRTGAFYGCVQLRSIDLPDGLKSILEGAFQDCGRLTDIEIPETVSKIKTGAFYGCISLKSIKIPEGVTEIEWETFENCINLETIQIPGTVTKIGSGAFKRCGKLVNIEIPEGLMELGEEAFSECKSLQTIQIPQEVRVIPTSTFEACRSLTDVRMLGEITWIGENAFSGCSSITNIQLPESVRNIRYGAFEGCSNLTELNIPEEVEEIGKKAFFNCGNLKEIEVPEHNMGKMQFQGYSDLKRIKISEGTKSIPAYAFFNYTELTHIKIPEGVTEIGANAFQNCTNLVSVTIPKSVTRIGENAFNGCKKLTGITIPSGVIEIGDGALSGCYSLKQIKVDEGNEQYIDDNGVLYTKDKTRLIKYPPAKEDKTYAILNEVTSIDKSAFSNSTYLISVEIPEGVSEIKFHTFFGCQNLENIKIPQNLKIIGRSAFEKCNCLTNIELPKGVTAIREGAFSNCSSLKYIKIPEGIRKIERGTFQDCYKLTIIDLPNNLEEIEGIAFRDCHSLTGINIPSKVTQIGRNAFQNCRTLTSIKIPEEVTKIAPWTFGKCINLKSIELPKGVLEVGQNALYGCADLEEIIIPEESAERIKLELYKNAGLDEERMLLFGDYMEAIKRIDAKSNFAISQDYDKKQMNMFYYKMIKSIGIDEIERIVELPNLTAEEIRKYSLEKDEAFQQMYNTQYKITGDLGIALRLLKQLQLTKTTKQTQDKNSPEIRIFKNLNQKLEQGYEGTLTELISIILQEEQIEVESDFIQSIKDLEKSANKGLIKNNFALIANQIEQALGQQNEQYENPIVQMQIEPIKAMVEDVVTDIFKENGKIDLETLRDEILEKIGNANAPYIIEKKEQIVQCVLGVFEKEENLGIINHSCLAALKTTKKLIGGAWKFKINQALRQLGYTFYNLPETLSKEEIDKLSEFLGTEQAFEIQTSPVAIPKQGIEREKAYRLLEKKGLPEIVTYKQIHDMFGSVYEPYSEKFREFFKKHRKEFWQNPELYDKFGQIHNNFERIINSPELRNIYQKGELTIDNVLGYLSEINYVNQRLGDEELAKLSKSVGKITTEDEFEHVQKIFDITRKRERTTVPPVFITKSKYRGRMLSPDDVLNLFAGNITTCCQTFNDVGEGSMVLGSIEENAGIFVIEELDENGNVGNIIGQSLTIRQKGPDGAYDRLTFDNIEITNGALEQMTEQDQKQILELYQEAGRQAIEKDKKFLGKLLKKGRITQEQYDALVLKEVIAGTGYNDLQGLDKLPEAVIVVPDEAYFKYRMINGSSDYAWIDSVGGESPCGSEGIPVILATIDSGNESQIKSYKCPDVKLSDVPLWYGRAGKVQNISSENCQEKHIKKIKQIERTVYRDSQQLMNDNDVYEISDIEYEYGIENIQIKLGSNNDWYLIYGDYDENEIMISDFAIIGGLNSENNVEETNGVNSNNAKLAIIEASNELYALLIEASKQGKKIYCNATSDTSLVNITRSLRKGLIEIKTMEGQDIKYVKGKGLVYAENEELVETREWDEDGEIQMLDLEIIPNREKLIEAKKKVQELLQRTQDMARMSGAEKEQGLDELRKNIRNEKTAQTGR